MNTGLLVWKNRCVSGSSVLGVKGEAEEEYRTGRINLTKANLGLDKVENTLDSEKNVGMVNGHTVKSNVPEDAKFTDTTYSAGVGLLLTENEFTVDINSALNSLALVQQSPADNDLIITKMVNDGTTNTTCYRPISALWNYIKSKADTSYQKIGTIATHAKSDTSLGGGTGALYGHVKLTDVYTEDYGAAAKSVGASSYALYRLFDAVNTAIATKLGASHANVNATASAYGHVKLSDGYTASAGGAASGVGASSLALYNAYTALNGALAGKLPTTASCNKNWNWAGKGGQPTWLWGGNDASNMYVYNPSNFSVNYANSAGSTGKLVCVGYGTSAIGDGGGDRALGVGDLLNNLAISSWYGVSFTTSCSGTPYTNRNAFSIDCRNGIAYGHVMDVNEYIILSNNKYLKTKNPSGATYNLIGINSANNLHIGDHNNSESGIYVHTRGSKQYNFTDAAFCPNVTNDVPLGLSSKLWKVVYAKTGTINTSDRTKKHDIKDLNEVYEKLFLNLQPKSFIFNDGDRVHIGAISQDVEDSMKELGLTAKEFAGFCKDIRYEYTKYNKDGTPVESCKVPCKDENGNIIYDYALRYDEFIFLTIHMVQKLYAQMNYMKEEIEKLKER